MTRLEKECDLTWVQENVPRLFEASLEGLGRVRDIVNNLRDFAHLDKADVDELDLNEAMQSTVEILRHEIEARQLLLKTYFGDVPSVICRPARIHQVFHNLLLNAIQASEPGATIEVRTATDHDEALVEVKDGGGYRRHASGSDL